MITCNLNGRLGNQMFQIAATIGTAIKNNVPYSIPKKTINMALFQPYYDHFIEHKIIGRIITHTESKNEYEPINYAPNTTLCLNGYFQSYKYFEHCREQIIDAFNFNYTSRMKGIVSIHVRRTDYLQLPDFTALGIDYYYRAITYFVEKGYTKFMVYSDNMEWCRRCLNDKLYKGCVFYYSSEDPSWDMKGMSSCEHNIIANSSFSWWGAWMNQYPNKIVIAPDTWFKGVNKDILPKEWIIIKNL